MKTLTISLGALLVAASAQAAQPQPAPATQPAAEAGVPQDEARKQDINDHLCLRHTGTRISQRSDTRKQRTCSNGAIGRAYTREDMQRTGEVDIADALRKLDPSIH
jgi:hypothetical protein